MKILYLMQVDWNWICQRPHFLAQGLGATHQVTVLYPHRYRRRGMQHRPRPGNVHPVYLLPRGDRYPVTSGINRRLWQKAVEDAVRKIRPDCLWLTYPTQIQAIRRCPGLVIYDCMDNHGVWYPPGPRRQRLLADEQALAERADRIFCSSQQLRQTMLCRYGKSLAAKTFVVRNGFQGPILPDQVLSLPAADEPPVGVYFGTISSWLDFAPLLKSLEHCPDLEYRLYGPVDGTEIPAHPRLRWMGTVEHDRLYQSVADANFLVMPFRVNELIRSVDPVKLYESINFGKEILAVEYPEIRRFAPFVHFYQGETDYLDQLDQILHRRQTSYTAAQRRRFLEENSWNSRVGQVHALLSGIGAEGEGDAAV